MALEREAIAQDIEGYLKRYEERELLRFVVVGSVDDGKSTLIGRLLHDTDAVYEDQLQAVKRASIRDAKTTIDFSLFTDGLKAEREQGITIDVAYRYFSTPARKFIIADTPGHLQYTRNMVTGASTAQTGITLIDARLGVLQQSRRHAMIAHLLGIPHLAVAINKMDLVGFDQQVYDRIRRNFMEFAEGLSFDSVTFFPVSALEGDNIVSQSNRTPWYKGPTVLHFLETVPAKRNEAEAAFRLPVQSVLRPNLNYRAFAGQIASGSVKAGDPVLALPSGRQSTVQAVDMGFDEIEHGFAPLSVALRLNDEIDISRGDLLVNPKHLPNVMRRFDAHLVWMSERPLDRQKSYILKHTTQSIRAEVRDIQFRIDLDSLEEVAAQTLELNDIGKVSIHCRRAVLCDAYSDNRSTGAFILIDSLSNDTVAAGMILTSETGSRGAQSLDEALKEVRAGSALEPKTQVSPTERSERMGQRGATVWLVGLPGSGRWTLAYALERRLFDLGRTAHVLDPTQEDLRSMISAAAACTNAGLVTICAFPTYGRGDRAQVRERVGADRVLEVFVNTSEALCRERRPEADFSGFEPPQHPDITVALESQPVEEAVEVLVKALEERDSTWDH